jgi:hypothetical protein
VAKKIPFRISRNDSLQNFEEPFLFQTINVKAKIKKIIFFSLNKASWHQKIPSFPFLTGNYDMVMVQGNETLCQRNNKCNFFYCDLSTDLYKGQFL